MFNLKTPNGTIENLTCEEVAAYIATNHKGHYLNNGCDVYLATEVAAAIAKNNILAVCKTKARQIRKPMAYIQKTVGA